jgi:ribonuclease III
MLAMIDKFNHIDAAALEQKLGYNFKDKELLAEALSHPSLKQVDEPKDHKDYERLELLGDSILGFLIVEILFHKFKASDEGGIAKFKSFLVCKETLYKIAKKLDLANYIVMTVGEEKSGGRSNPNNLENALEAIIAAIYLDSDIHVTKSIVLKLWDLEIKNVSSKDLDPKTHLQEWSQANGYGMPIYEIIGKTGPVHAPIFTIDVRAGSKSSQGTGKSIKLAEKDAARKLLNKI